MKGKLIVVYLILCVIIAFPLLAGGEQEKGSAEMTSTKWVGEKFGGELNFAMNAGPPTPDTPTTSAASAQYLAVQINETLVALSEDYKVVPMLAESWDLSADKKAYTFHLRKGVKFHNGEEMTSADVVASFNRFRLVSPRAGSFDLVQMCSAVDNYTVKFQLEKPSRVFLTNLA